MRENDLDVSLVREGTEGLGSLGALDGHGGLGHSRGSLEVEDLAVGLGLGLEGGVLLDAVDEVQTALGVADVLDAQVDLLLHVAAVDDLVDDHADGVGGDVEDHTCASRIEGSVSCVCLDRRVPKFRI